MVRISPKKIIYFGYGANRSLEMMQAITGNTDLVGYPAVLKGFKLCIQRLDQTPIKVQKILRQSWLDNFESYIIAPGEEKDEVLGTIWELTSLERELVRNWELIDMGWYKDMVIKVTTQDGRKIDAQTEGLRDGQVVDRKVSGKKYKTFLNPVRDFEKSAKQSREEYLLY